MSPPRIAIAGTGAFAGTLLRALARHREPLDLSVLGSDAGRAGELAELARDHAALSGAPPPAGDTGPTPATRTGWSACWPPSAPTSWWSAPPNTAPRRAAPPLRLDGPGVPSRVRPDPALQTGHVLRYARAAERAAPDTLLVNACFPDAVNPLLTALGAPVVCGVGNVATLAAALAARTGVADPGDCTCWPTTPTCTPPKRPASTHGPGWTGPRRPDRRTDRGPPARPEPPQRGGGAGRRGPLAALAGAGPSHTGHLPGPARLPGGYP